MAASGLSVSRGCLVALVGPTAVGKSDIALRLAEQNNGEIISVDSMQVYRGMDIGTAKPSTAERARIPHHLIDIVDLATPFDAAQFVTRAGQAIEEIRQRRRLPILCGGTGLYLKALLDGLGQAPAGNPDIRAELESTPLSELLSELAQRDPRCYEQIDRQNPRRVVRALEVIRLTGEPYSLQRSDWSASTRLAPGISIVGLTRDLAALRQRIEARVDAMFEHGLVAETQELLAGGLSTNRTALQALGYRQVVEHLQRARSLPETISLVKTRTRQFAKRQMTWFRRQLPVHWIEVTALDTVPQVVERVGRHFHRLEDFSADHDSH